MPTAKSPTIRPKVLCVFRRAGRILLFPIVDCMTGETLLRPFGGGIEFGERSEDALAREIMEELGAAIRDPMLLGVLESSFVFGGEREHEISFVFDAQFVDATTYALDTVRGVEANGKELLATWVAIEETGSGPRVVPEGLIALLGRPGA